MAYLLAYPPTLTDAQIAETLASNVKRMWRWPEYVELEHRHSLDALPDEPRVCGLFLARRVQLHRYKQRRAREAWGKSGKNEILGSLSIEPYKTALAAHVPAGRLHLLIADIQHVGEKADQAEENSLFEQAVKLVGL